MPYVSCEAVKPLEASFPGLKFIILHFNIEWTHFYIYIPL